MNFDFTNYTYSGILAIFAAIFGIGYPLLHQAADGINTIYDSSRITRLFWKEEKFQTFNALLRICLIFSVFIPFVLCLSDGLCYVVVTLLVIHTWITYRLGYTVIQLTRLMRKYKDGSELFTHLKRNQFDDWLVYLDIAYYAAKKDNYILYHDCLMHIANNFEDLSEARHQELMKKMFDYSSRNDAPEFFMSRSDFFEFLFARFPKDKVDMNLHRLLWRALSKNVRKNNHDWIMNYWEHADQFYRFEIEDDDTVAKTVRDYFLSLHIALGALFVYHGRYDWCDDIGRFSNIEPPHYDLVPSTFSEIWKKQLHFLDSLDNPCELEQMYSLGGHYGIRSENVVYRYIVKYLATLMLRLKDMNYNVRYADPMALPSPFTEDRSRIIPQNRKYIQQAEFLLQRVKEVAMERQNDCDDAIELINSFKEQCQAEINKIDKENKVDRQKEERIKQNLLSEFEQQKQHLVLDGLSSLQKGRAIVVQKETCVKTLLDKEDICQGVYRCSINLEEVIINQLMHSIQQTYKNNITAEPPLETYTIRFQDVGNVIEKLQANSDYAILAYCLNLEVLYPNKTTATIKDFSAYRSEFILLRKSSLPYIQFNTKEELESGTCTTIPGRVPLYTNLATLQNKIDNHCPPILDVRLAYQLVTTTKSPSYILFEVCAAVTEDRFDYAKINENTIKKLTYRK